MNLALNEVSDDNITWQQFKIQKELEGANYKHTKLVGDLILERQEILMGHIIRLDQNDLMKQVTFTHDLYKPEFGKNRQGGPRLNWIDDNLQRLHEKVNSTKINNVRRRQTL